MKKMTKKKKQVIDHAVALFSEYGYNQIGVDRICEESDVSKMTVYKYFPSKEILFEAALNERSNLFIQGVISATTQYESPADKLKAIFIYYHDWFNDENFVGCLFINSIALVRGNENVFKLVKQNKNMVRQIIEGILCFIIETEEVPVVANQIIKLLDGAVISAQLGFEKEPAYNAWVATGNLLKDKEANIDIGTF